MQHDIPEHKVCPNCNEDKPAAEYHRNAARKDGLTYVCATCIPDYEAREKRPKRNLSELEKTCASCARVLASRRFQYAQNTEDHLRDSCRTCSAFKPKRTPTPEEIFFYESNVEKIVQDTKNRFDLEVNRSEAERFVYDEMNMLGMLEEWSPPVWVHKSSK